MDTNKRFPILFEEKMETPFGDFLIQADEIGICTAALIKIPEHFLPRPNPTTTQAVQELKEYFEGRRKEFTVPIHPHGTDFQLRVWEAARNIPYGKTISYGELAAWAGNPKAARGVGQALNRNPILIITPCHRIIGKNGSLTGFGAGIAMKAALLALEQVRC